MLRTAAIAVILILAFVAGAQTPSCRMIEVEVAGVDSDGAFQPVFNFGQGLPVGEKWGTLLEGKGATLKVAVTWENEIEPNSPKISLAVQPAHEGASQGVVVLELLLWQSLAGPDPVLTHEKKPLVLPGVGSLFAVAAVSPIECAGTDG